MANNLIEVLKQVKPQRVLFTTFTLSLSWFEAFVLPTLQSRRSTQVDLLVDARYYRRLCRAAESAYAGTAFRISAVQLPSGGFFHPKIAYLQAEDLGQDVLVIASGNLTTSGQGGNLEVLDAVCVSDHPHVFEEFSSFCLGLSANPGLAEKASQSMQYFSGRAHEAFLAAPAAARDRPRTTWLVHTLNEPALPQLARAVEAQLAKPRTLTVLSPYHTATGDTIGALSQACEAASIRIALRQRPTSTAQNPVFDAPFDEDAKGLPAKVRYVVEAHQLERVRLAHAKCFEVTARSKTLVMTGSVNATCQSLQECANVEVSLIRQLSTSPFSWRAHEPDSNHPCEFIVSAENLSSGVIDASLEGLQVKGTVRPVKGPLQVNAELWVQDNLRLTVPQVELTAAGTFCFTLDASLNDTNSALLKLMDEEGEVACGWLSVEASLSKSPVDTTLADVLTRFGNHKASEDDFRHMLNHFKRLLSVPSPREPGKPPTSRPGSGPRVKGRSRISSREEVMRLLPYALEAAPQDEVALTLLRDSAAVLLGNVAGRTQPGSISDAFSIHLQQWINAFSRPRFLNTAPAWVKALYYGMACVARHLAPSVFPPEFLAEMLERVLGAPMSNQDCTDFERCTLGLPEFSALVNLKAELAESALDIATAQSTAKTLESLLIARLGKTPKTPPYIQAVYKELDTKLQALARDRQRTQRSLQGVLGLISEAPQELNPQTGCPLCKNSLGAVELVEQLRRTGYGFHTPGCKHLLIVGVPRSALAQIGLISESRTTEVA